VSDLFAARTQMALSLGFHILFAVVGMAMPALMVAAELMWRRTGRRAYCELAKRWAKGTAILFAVGAVSGTVLSFELGLLWPTFMEKSGPLIGLPFSLEGYAFFLESIFLGVYLYGWDKVRPSVHLAAGVGVAISGLLSGIFVVGVNAWMNTPTGFVLDDTGAFTQIDPWQVFAAPAFFTEALHMALAAYASVAVMVLGIHAYRLLGTPDDDHGTRRFHVAAIRISFGFALVSIPLQMLSGDLAAKHLAKHQPLKLAAAEALFDTQKQAPLSVFGVVDEDKRELRYALEIPGALSFLSFSDFNAEVKGLNDFDDKDWPPVAVTHVAFDVMVGCGMGMAALVGLGALLGVLRARREGWETFLAAAADDKRWLKLAVLCSPLGFIAVEAGWTVTEVGRQPWIISGVMRTTDAVTPVTGLQMTLLGHAAVFLVLGVVVVSLLRAHVFKADVDLADVVTDGEGGAA